SIRDIKMANFRQRRRRFGFSMPGRIRSLWLPACWCCLLFTLVPTAQAALQFDVFVGYGSGVTEGVVPEASWFPLTVEVHNDGPSFTGVIEVTSGQLGHGLSRVLVMELPNGTRKREILPVYSASRYGTTWDVRLRDEKGRVRAERLNLKPRRVTPRESLVFAALTRTIGGMPTLPDTKANRSDFQPATARLLPELFPENPIVLQGLDALYLHSEKALELKVNQVNALLA